MRLPFDADPLSVRTARRAVRDLVAESDLDGDNVDDAALCTSELVSNAVLHGCPPLWLEARVSGDVLRVEVHDGAAGRAVDRRVGVLAGSGRGLKVVDAIADRWSSEPAPDGKVVWFELCLSRRTQESSRPS